MKSVLALVLLCTSAFAEPASSAREPQPPPSDNSATRDHAPPPEKPHDRRLPSTRTHPRRDDTKPAPDK